MLPVHPTLIDNIMRRSLTGALGTDPVLTERRRVARRPTHARRAPDGARVARTPATASRSS